MRQEELEHLQSKALAQFKTGKSLFGKEGAFAPLLKQFLEAALDAEMDQQLDENERVGGNKRNGKGTKTIKSSVGSFEIATPQDRKSSFEPDIIKKRQTILADNLEDKNHRDVRVGDEFSRYQCPHSRYVRHTDIAHGY